MSTISKCPGLDAALPVTVGLNQGGSGADQTGQVILALVQRPQKRLSSASLSLLAACAVEVELEAAGGCGPPPGPGHQARGQTGLSAETGESGHQPEQATD